MRTKLKTEYKEISMKFSSLWNGGLAACFLAVSANAQAIAPFALKWENAPNGGLYNSSEHPDAVFVIEAYQLRCGPCNTNVPNLHDLAGFYGYEPRVQILDLGIDRSPRDYQQWIAKHEPVYPVLNDARRQVWSQLGGSGTPTTWVLDCKLNVKWKHV